MTHKELSATNLHGILKVTLTDELLCIRFSPDNPEGMEIALAIAIDPATEALDNVVPVV